MIRNKARLEGQGYSQMEGVNYDEKFALVARMEFIGILLALACHLKFKLYQMDVKTAFLNGFLKEDVYVAQPMLMISSSGLQRMNLHIISPKSCKPSLR